MPRLIGDTNFEETEFMNWNQLEGKWKQIKNSAKERWGKLTDDDLDIIAGKRDSLLEKLHERYGITKVAAQQEADAWLRTMKEESERHYAGRH
jgi:uncharacterized protein YjbJ (UPF0337 family)